MVGRVIPPAVCLMLIFCCLLLLDRLPNLYWWADREKGVGGIVASQILPFAGTAVLL